MALENKAEKLSWEKKENEKLEKLRKQLGNKDKQFADNEKKIVDGLEII